MASVVSPATLSIVCLLLGPAGPTYGADLPKAKLLGGPWSSGEGFTFEKNKNKARRSVSGVACPSGVAERRTCLFAFDEGVEVRFGELGGGTLLPIADQIPLLAEGGELDAEGAALDGDVFYITSSHSPKRSTCASNPQSRHVFRFRRDPTTGRAMLGEGGKPKGLADSGKLWSLMASMPEFAAHLGDGKCLGSKPPKGQRAVNIEGLAAKSGRLYFGFRGPAIGGTAPVLAVDAAGLFDDGAANAKVTHLFVGEKRGIRDLQAVADGFLVLAGPDDDSDDAAPGETADWVIGFWDGTSGTDGITRPTLLARLELGGLVRGECDREIKPEAITVLEENDRDYRVVVLSDGMCDGGPLDLRIGR